MAQVGQLYLGTQVQALHCACIAQIRRQGAAEHVVTLQRRIGEGGDLGDERVGAHEAVQCIAELQALLVAHLLEASLRRPEERVGLGRALVIRHADSEESGHRRLDLLWPEHIEVIESSACVPQDVGVSRRGDRAPVELLERIDDGFGVVAEVQDEGVLLQRVDAVEPGERLDGGEPHQDLVHVHRVQQWLVEAGLELLRHDEHAVIRAWRTPRRSGFRGSRSCWPQSGEVPEPSSIFPENATSVRMSS